MDLKGNPFFLDEVDIEWVHDTFNNLSVEEKVGQLFVFNVSIFGFKKELKDVLSCKPGGIFLFPSLASLQRRKVKYIQKNSQIPPLIAGDLEFGAFTGIVNGTYFNSNMGVAASNNEDFAYKLGLVSGREGRSVGYNWTYSPVVDINYNHQNPITHIRSFGDNPELVSKMAISYIKGAQEAGIAATAKHWPGDGTDDRNQHLCTTINSFDMDRWRETYGKVYKDVIRAGVKSIMCAHVALPAYDNLNGKSIPGTLSYKINNDLLRKELGFNGLIVTDALDMAGFNSQGNKDELTPKAIAVGCDMLLFSSNRAHEFHLIKEAVKNGLITEQRLNDAVMRILAVKASLKLHKYPLLPKKQIKKQYVKSKEHLQWSNECIKSSITLVKDTQNIFPISSDRYKKVLLIRTGDMLFLLRKFPSYLKSKGFQVDIYKKGIKRIFKNYDLLIYLLNETPWFTRTTPRMMKLAQDAGFMRSPHMEVPAIFISFGNPYHLYELPTMKTLINCYNPIKRTQKILIDMLTGKLPFKGISPVDAFCGLKDAEP